MSPIQYKISTDARFKEKPIFSSKFQNMNLSLEFLVAFFKTLRYLTPEISDRVVFLHFYKEKKILNVSEQII